MKTQPPTGHFSLHIGGKERTGKVDMEGLCRIESELGNISMLEALNSGTAKWGFNITVTVLWVGLSTVNPAITRKHITTWIGNALESGEATLIDFVKASMGAVVTALGSQIRQGFDKLEAGEEALADVDAKAEPSAEEGEDKRPLGKGKNLRSA